VAGGGVENKNFFTCILLYFFLYLHNFYNKNLHNNTHSLCNKYNMLYLSKPIPDCNNITMVQDSYFSNNKTIGDCWLDHKEAVSGRIYLAAAIFNGVGIITTTIAFIYCAAGTLSSADKPPTLNFISAQKIKQTWRRHSLQKRSIMGTVLGAIGHLIFSSGIFLAQATSGNVGCELYLWSIMIGFYTWMYALLTRAYRLRFLFRLNQLKVKCYRMSTAERCASKDDTDYKWYLANRNKIGRKLLRPYIVYLFTIALMLAISIPLEVAYRKEYGYCDIGIPAILLIVYYAFFVVFIIPFILCYLRHNADAHGIRTEIWIDTFIGIPYFILYIIFFAVLSPSVLFIAHDGQMNLFAPANWIVFFTAAAHIVSVVMPVISYIPIQNKHWVKFRDNVGRRCSLIKKPAGNTGFSAGGGLVRVLSPTSPTLGKALTTSKTLEHASTSLSAESYIPELSVDSLERSMADPRMMLELQDLAIRDFSSENLLFYECYLQLAAILKQELLKKEQKQKEQQQLWQQQQQQQQEPQKEPQKEPQEPQEPQQQQSSNWMYSFLQRRSSSSAGILTKARLKNATREDIEQQENLTEFLSTPIPCKMYKDFARFYETFIGENTSSQVNISYRARHVIDEVFAKLYQRYPQIKPEKECGCFPGISDASPSFPPYDYLYRPGFATTTTSNTAAHHEERVPILTMNVFEAARREVCWNIFNSVFPKFVDMYNV
jgi:hypothetical protein